jgi:hypothetical protein
MNHHEFNRIFIINFPYNKSMITTVIRVTGILYNPLDLA